MSLMETSSLRASSFDLAISNYVLMDLPDIQSALDGLFATLRPGGIAIAIFSHPCFPKDNTTTVDEDPRSSVVTYRWTHSYFESRAHLAAARGRFTSAFPTYHRALSDDFGAFRTAGVQVTDCEEPRLQPERFHLARDEYRKRRSRLQKPPNFPF